MSNCIACDCTLQLQNTGTGCTPLMGITKKPIIVPYYDNEGDVNGIPFSDSLSQAYFTALINDTDDSKRWFPLPEVKNVDDNRGDADYEEFDDHTKAFIQENVRIFMGEVIGNTATGSASPQMKGKIEAARCGDIGVFLVDNFGNLIGSISSDGLSLNPIKIDPQTVYVKLGKANLKNKTVQKLYITWNYAITELDENLRMIACNELGGADLLGLRGLLTVTSILTNLTQDGFSMKLITNFGTPTNPGLVKGLTITDFISSDSGTSSTIYNSTTETDVDIDTVTESPDGTYNFTLDTTQNSGDVMVPDASHNGFDFSALPDNPWTVPVT